MRISRELILRCSSKNLLPNQSGDEDPLQRITHLYLQEQYIKNIENLEMCINVIALYLYENKIEKIENLESLERLSCLYLQNNRLQKVENLQELTKLTILNISHNAIQKLEGLEMLCELRELYVQFQKLPENQALEIEDESIAGISESLRVLNISGNSLQSLSPLKPLTNLETLTAEDNDIRDLEELLDVMENWKLVNVKLSGNPVFKVRKYRDSVVMACLDLEELDGKVVCPLYRNFLQNWKQGQKLQARKEESYEVLKPFLEQQIHNKQLSPPHPTPASSGPGSSSQSESSSTSAAVRPRSKSVHRKDRSTSRTRSLQEMPMKLVKKLTRSKK